MSALWSSLWPILLLLALWVGGVYLVRYIAHRLKVGQ